MILLNRNIWFRHRPLNWSRLLLETQKCITALEKMALHICGAVKIASIWCIVESSPITTIGCYQSTGAPLVVLGSSISLPNFLCDFPIGLTFLKWNSKYPTRSTSSRTRRSNFFIVQSLTSYRKPTAPPDFCSYFPTVLSYHCQCMPYYYDVKRKRSECIPIENKIENVSSSYSFNFPSVFQEIKMALSWNIKIHFF